MDGTEMAAGSQRDWPSAANAFQRFLNWLDQGVDSGGETYLEMRRRLVFYFDRKNCVSPDDLADETLRRVARRLEEEGEITGKSPAHYCYIVASFLFLEYQRRPARKHVSLGNPSEFGDVASRLAAPPQEASPTDAETVRLHCLESCLEGLGRDDRDLIVGYYRGEQRVKIEHRRTLATRLGLTPNALSIRACRIRAKLEACVKTCCARHE
jgi:DNA-directed RNA polymerase specialized sigma24 family protein